MPNMTRRSIERCHGDGYSSPDLTSSPLSSKGKLQGIQCYFCVYFLTLFYCFFFIVYKGLHPVYKKMHDFEDDLDENETYHLKVPDSYGSKAYPFLSSPFIHYLSFQLSNVFYS